MLRDFVQPRVDAAHQQADLHRRRLEALKSEQKNLLQLHHKGLVDDEVLAEEQQRIQTERAHARQMHEHASHEVADVLEAVDEALALVGPTFPYHEADDPVLRELLNQATHLELIPYIEDDWDGTGAPPVKVRGKRDPVYDMADAALGLDRQAAAAVKPRKPESLSKRVRGCQSAPGVRTAFTAPRCRRSAGSRPASCAGRPVARG